MSERCFLLIPAGEFVEEQSLISRTDRTIADGVFAHRARANFLGGAGARHEGKRHVGVAQ